jgi:hypothetical protein
MCYEYKIIYFRVDLFTASGLPKDINEKFDLLGNQGWEYEDMRQITSGGFFLMFVGIFSRTKQFIVVFKRPILESTNA